MQLAAEGLVKPSADERVEQVRHLGLHPGQHLGTFDGRKDAGFVHLFDNQRHRAHHCRTDLLHHADENARGRGLLDIIDAGADEDRVQAADAHLIGVGHRQDAEEAVFLVTGLCLKRFNDVVAEIPVAEHDALGVAGRAGSIDDGGEVVRCRVLDDAVALECIAVFLDELEGLDVDDEGQFLTHLVAEFGHATLRDEDDLALGVGQDVGDFVFAAVGQDRDGDASEGGRGEERNGPVRHVLRQDGHLVTCADAEAEQTL